MNDNLNGQNNNGINNNYKNNSNGMVFNNGGQTNNQDQLNNNMNLQNKQSIENVNNVYNNSNQMNNGNQQPQYNNQQFNGINSQYNQNSYQNNVGNVLNNNDVTNYDNKKKSNKLKIIIIGMIAVAALLIIISSLSNKGDKKVLTCSTNHAVFGMYYSETYEYSIKDERVSVKYIVKTDLEKSKNAIGQDVDDWAKQKIDSTKKECESITGCKFNYSHSNGKELELVTILEENYWGNKFDGQTAEEIYNNQKTRHKNGEVDGSVYMCE